MIQQFIKFCVVGGSGVFIDFGITYLCKEWLRLNKYLANSLGFLCASTSNYVLNRIWTFHNENPDIAGQYLRFLGIAAVGLVINNLTIYLLHERWKLNFYLVLISGVLGFRCKVRMHKCQPSGRLASVFLPDGRHWFFVLLIERNGSPSTPKNASRKMPPLIFEVPSRRSTKMIDTSLSLSPSRHAEYFISIWNPYPFIFTASRSIVSSAWRE